LCERTEEIVERTQVMDKIEKSEAIVDERETAPTRLSPPHRKSAARARAGLRVCPKISGGITKFSEHEAD
jgi:hypothetical protein